MKVAVWLALATLLSAAPDAVAQAVPAMARVRGELAFDGKASLGDFAGTTTTLQGAIIAAATPEAVRGWVEAPAGTLRTGNGRRDRDMFRSLEVERHPVLRFDLDAVAIGPADGDSARGTLRGRFTIHGVTREAGIPGWLWLTATSARFRGRVPIDLRDYQIGGLSKLLGVLKMHPEIVVRVDVRFES